MTETTYAQQRHLRSVTHGDIPPPALPSPNHRSGWRPVPGYEGDYVMQGTDRASFRLRITGAVKDHNRGAIYVTLYDRAWRRHRVAIDDLLQAAPPPADSAAEIAKPGGLVAATPGKAVAAVQERSSLPPVPTPDMTARHIASMRMARRSEQTIKCRQSILRLLAACLGSPPQDATPAGLYRWRESIDHMKASSIHTYVAQIQTFYAWLQAEGYRLDNPAAGLPAPPLQAGIPKPISEQDLMAAVAAARPRIRPWLVLAGWCGLRAKEIAYLRRENVRLDAEPPVIVIAGDATKGRRGRVVPIPPFAADVLRAVPPATGEWMFARADGLDGPNFPHLVSQRVNDYLRERGIVGTLHGGRHRYATQLYRGTHDLRLVQEMLGHQSPITTAVYTKVELADEAAAVAALPVPREVTAG